MQITYLTPELTLQDRVTNTMMTMIMMMIRMMRIMIVAVLYDLSAYTRNCGNFFFTSKASLCEYLGSHRYLIPRQKIFCFPVGKREGRPTSHLYGEKTIFMDPISISPPSPLDCCVPDAKRM